MNKLLPLLFLTGYFLGGYAAIYYHVVIQKIADPKFIGAVELYYPVWIGVYSPIAVLGTIVSVKTGKTFRQRCLLAATYLIAILLVIFLAYRFDVNYLALLTQYVFFSILFYLALRYFPNLEERKTR